MTGRDCWLFAAGFATGWLGLLIVKYYVIGIEEWDEDLHPERLPCDT